MPEKVYVLKPWDRAAFTSRPKFWKGLKRRDAMSRHMRPQPAITQKVVAALGQVEMKF